MRVVASMFLLLSIVFQIFVFVGCSNDDENEFAGKNVTLPYVDIRHFTNIVQYGIPRSASTVQFQALCIAVIVKMNSSSTSCEYSPDKFIKASNSSNSVRVIKTHIGGSWAKLQNVALFFSSKSKQTAKAPENTVYKQEYEKFIRRGMSIIFDYAMIFGLSDFETKIFHEYMVFWSIVRTCCGSQSSYDWRLELHNSSKPRTHAHYDYDSHRCTIYDLDAVVERLKSTTICRSHYGTGVHFCKLPKKYCSNSIERIKNGEDFNGRQWVENEKRTVFRAN